ncbi:MAG: hypothetical protein NTV33_12450 [Coprothermobacterota bacterium]|nr:hypothetical protein [Coprothermobacterota bacterium]
MGLEANRSKEQPTRGRHSRGYQPRFDTERPGGYSARNSLQQHVTEHPAGGYLVKLLEGFFLGKIALSWKNDTAWWSQENRMPHWGAAVPGSTRLFKTIIAIIAG